MHLDQVQDTSAVAAAPQSTNGPPRVSVVIPCYNQGHFVHEAIESVLAQTYADYEIVVVDDGSTDQTSEVVSRYPGVRCIRQRNRGLPAARNRGIQESQGEFLVFLDADDRLLPKHFEFSLHALRSSGGRMGMRRFSVSGHGSDVATSASLRAVAGSLRLFATLPGYWRGPLCNVSPASSGEERGL